MKFKIMLIIFSVFFIRISANAGQLTAICVKSVSYTAPFWGSTTYKLIINDGTNDYTIGSNTEETKGTMKVWLSIALSAKSLGKQIGIYNDPGTYDILSVSLLDTNCP